MVRSTWDYALRREEFLAWADRAAASTRVLNDPAVLRWNTDKAYLRDLAGAGVPVVPTTWLAPGEPVALPAHAGDLVVKPTVSAGARDTGRFAPDHAGRTAAAALAQRLLDAGRPVMVQPYQASVDAEGERALVFVAGAYSHTARKGALLTAGAEAGDVDAALFASESIDVARPTAAERELAEAVLDAVPHPREHLLYARVDVVTGPAAGGGAGAPLLLELELTEPSLFLTTAPGAADRLAAAVLRA